MAIPLLMRVPRLPLRGIRSQQVTSRQSGSRFGVMTSPQRSSLLPWPGSGPLLVHLAAGRRKRALPMPRGGPRRSRRRTLNWSAFEPPIGHRTVGCMPGLPADVTFARSWRVTAMQRESGSAPGRCHLGSRRCCAIARAARVGIDCSLGSSNGCVTHQVPSSCAIVAVASAKSRSQPSSRPSAKAGRRPPVPRIASSVFGTASSRAPVPPAKAWP